MKRMAAAFVFLLLLTGCSGEPKEWKQGLSLRSEILKASECRYSCDITADYGDKTYTFSMDCVGDEQGNLSFTVTAPETIAGITGSISGSGGKLTFGDTALQFDLMADDQLSPVSAPWVLLKTLRGGCMTSAGTEDGKILLSIDDSYDDDALHLFIRLNGDNRPESAEILFGNRRILSMNIKNFEIV